MINIYRTIPQLAQWKADSSIAFAIRSHDEGLARVDYFLEEYHRAAKKGGSHCGFVLCDLFLALNNWVKRFHAVSSQAMHRGTPDMGRTQKPVQPGLSNVSASAYDALKQRYPAVLKLLDVVFQTLNALEITKDADPDEPAVKIRDFKANAPGESFGPRYNGVTKMVMEMVSVDMKPAGAVVDERKGMRPFSDNQLAQYRVWFKGGKAFQVNWWNNEPSLKLNPANSLHSFNEQGATKCSSNFGAFIMTTDLEVFMTRHSVDDGIFHSSYTNQKPVLFAGTMLIENGAVRAVRCDSGHYRPNTHEFRRFLQHLSAMGVPMSRVKVYDFQKDKFLGMANDFMTEKKTVVVEKQKTVPYNEKIPAPGADGSAPSAETAQYFVP